MLKEALVVDKIEILEDGIIQVRTTNRIMKDGVKIAETYSRHCLEPGVDLSAEDARVAAIAGFVHDKKTVNDFIAAKAEKEAKLK